MAQKTIDFKNDILEPIASLKEDLSNKITKFYASNQGETHITDSDNGKIQDMMIYGKSSQDGTPTPENPVEIKCVVNPTIKLLGSNILKMTDGEYQKNGVTIAVSNGVAKLKGTADAKLNIVLTNNIIFKEGTKIIFSPNRVKGMEEPDGAHLDLTNNTTKGFSINSNSINIPYIIKKEDAKHSFNVYIRIPAGTNFDEIWKPQILIGETITAFEPYTEQTITLPITLNAIPVSSGGNVTIDGQQYIADRVVEKNGIFGIERNTATDVPVLTKNLSETPDLKGRFLQNFAFEKAFTVNAPLVNIGYGKNWGVAGNVIDKWIFGVHEKNFYISPPKDMNYTSEDIFNALKDLNIKVYGVLLVPFFEPLPGDIQAKLRTLVANYPVTNISVTSDQLDGYTVFNYPISIANGWNYVKQQLNDNRDYIYDMDTQSAEAYVNSEYAVALTELEV